MLRILDRLTTRRAPGCARGSHFLRLFATGGSLWPDAAQFGWTDIVPGTTNTEVRVLLVVAHPDDESECAATIYRITHELGGVVDQAIVTDGGAGFHWSGPAESFYGVPLANRTVARRNLPRIRRAEVLRANKILGVRDTYFFEQQDTGFTFDPSEALRTWDSPSVRDSLVRLIDRGQYDLTLTLLPTEDTHGHHQTVAILLLEAVTAFPAEQRPAILGVRTANEDVDADEFSQLPQFPSTRTANSRPDLSFDRKSPIKDTPLDHSIVVNWVIAEHKSQGMFQMEFGRRRYEQFWLFEASGATGRAKWERVLAKLRPPSGNDAALPDLWRQAYA